jgi:hypothetical protein
LTLGRLLRPAALLLVLSWSGGVALGQTLGELADHTKKKRRGGAPTYSDDDLKKRQPGASPAPGAAAPVVSGGEAGSSESSGGEGGSSESNGSEGEGDEGRTRQSGRRDDQSYWQQQAASHRANIQDAERRIAAAQLRLNALLSDLVPSNVGDPFQQQTLEANRAEARRELEQAEQNLERAEDAFHEFEEEARRLAIPPGWLEER